MEPLPVYDRQTLHTDRWIAGVAGRPEAVVADLVDAFSGLGIPCYKVENDVVWIEVTGARLIGAVCVAVAALAICSPAASAVGGPVNWMYEPTTFTEVDLTLPPASITALEAEPKEYVEGEFSLAETDGTPGSAGPFSTPLTVGIELKGNLGSLRSVNEKAAFKIKFDKFVEGQRFLGLEKMTLNNMVQDPSMIHEATTYQAFDDMGVPAPHVGYTYLTVNGKSYGVHLNIETQDAQSVENAFGTTFLAPPQHIYAGEYGADVTNEPWHGTATKAWEAIEVSEGKKKEKGDLEALVAAVEATSTAFSERVASTTDLTEMTRDWMVEKYVGNWDGYAGNGPDYNHPNNYYLYSDASGRFQMMPWGTDQTWQSVHHVSFGAGGGVLFTDCVADTAGCRQSYLAAGLEALAALNATSLDTVARCTAAAVRPWQELEAATSEREKLPDPALDGEETLQGATAEVAATRSFIASRPQELAEFLSEPTPPPQTAEPACPPLRTIPDPEVIPQPEPDPDGTPAAPGQTSTVSPTQPSTATPTAIPAPRLAWVSVVRRGRAVDPVSISLQLPGPGRVMLRGTYGKAAREACHGAATVGAGGQTTVTCQLRDRFALLLERRARRIRLHVRFVPEAGSVEAIARSVELRRWPTYPSSS